MRTPSAPVAFVGACLIPRATSILCVFYCTVLCYIGSLCAVGLGAEEDHLYNLVESLPRAAPTNNFLKGNLTLPDCTVLLTKVLPGVIPGII